MEITAAQFEQIEHCLPTQRGNVSLSDLQILNAILYVAEHGCKWRGLPKRFGNWDTIYTRMNRRSTAGARPCVRAVAAVPGRAHQDRSRVAGSCRSRSSRKPRFHAP